MVYRFDEHKAYPDTLFAFEKDSFSMKEFELEMESTDSDQTKIFDGNDNSVHLSITNLSDLEDERKKIVEKWISDDPTQTIDKDAKITELKTNVVFKFFKGIDTDDLAIDQERIKMFELIK
jgi:predicted AlkP superfamily phosphohydrolase/phosphomutase